ncbi:hypothetical protein [Moraxella lacunata]|uniref:hypothetical protein n=1 Tax=Moraxella lacunata TaxID=477 RepID=UPI003EE2E372
MIRVFSLFANVSLIVKSILCDNAVFSSSDILVAYNTTSETSWLITSFFKIINFIFLSFLY